MEGMSSPPGEKQVKRVKSDYSGPEAWLDAHRDPVSSLYTFSSCIGKTIMDCHCNIYAIDLV